MQLGDLLVVRHRLAGHAEEADRLLVIFLVPEKLQENEDRIPHAQLEVAARFLEDLIVQRRQKRAASDQAQSLFDRPVRLARLILLRGDPSVAGDTERSAAMGMPAIPGPTTAIFLVFMTFQAAAGSSCDAGSDPATSCLSPGRPEITAACSPIVTGANESQMVRRTRRSNAVL